MISASYRLMLTFVATLILRPGACQGSDQFPVIRQKDMKDHPELSCYRWPTPEQMRTALVPDALSTMAGMRAVEAAGKVIRPTALPKNLRGRLVGLRRYVNGCDAIVTRHKCPGFVIQLVVTSARVTLLVRDVTGARRATKEHMLRFVREAIERFFNESEVLLEIDLTLAERGVCLQALNPAIRNGERCDNLRSWTETLEWWTNGELIWLRVFLQPGASAAFVNQKDWFSGAENKK